MLKIRLAAPPVDGKANDALIAWLSERTGAARWGITLKSGASSRRKTLMLGGITAAELQLVLAPRD